MSQMSAYMLIIIIIIIIIVIIIIICSHVVHGLDGKLVSGPVWTHSHCREVQL